jgi:hypothetical protein
MTQGARRGLSGRTFFNAKAQRARRSAKSFWGSRGVGRGLVVGYFYFNHRRHVRHRKEGLVGVVGDVFWGTLGRD